MQQSTDLDLGKMIEAHSTVVDAITVIAKESSKGQAPPTVLDSYAKVLYQLDSSINTYKYRQRDNVHRLNRNTEPPFVGDESQVGDDSG